MKFRDTQAICDSVERGLCTKPYAIVTLMLVSSCSDDMTQQSVAIGVKKSEDGKKKLQVVSKASGTIKFELQANAI